MGFISPFPASTGHYTAFQHWQHNVSVLAVTQTHIYTYSDLKFDCKLTLGRHNFKGLQIKHLLRKHLLAVADKQSDKCKTTCLHGGTFLLFPLRINTQTHTHSPAVHILITARLHPAQGKLSRQRALRRLVRGDG